MAFASICFPPHQRNGGSLIYLAHNTTQCQRCTALTDGPGNQEEQQRRYVDHHPNVHRIVRHDNL